MSSEPRLMKSTLRVTPATSERVRAVAAGAGLPDPDNCLELLVQAGIIALALGRVGRLPPAAATASDALVQVQLMVSAPGQVTRPLSDEQQMGLRNACRRTVGLPV